MTSWDQSGVRTRIREMAALDPDRQRFGADTHGYELGPRLPEAGDDRAVDDEWRGDRLPGRLAAPFPLTNPLPGPLRVPADSLTQGSLMLAERGCGMYVRLVLNGPNRGEVWELDPDWGGFVPVSAGFRAWYADWLASP